MKRSLYHPDKFVVHFKLRRVRLTWVGAGWVEWAQYRAKLQKGWPWEPITIIREPSC
jgi:hypothetical protein